jgi:hypothetical protein
MAGTEKHTAIAAHGLVGSHTVDEYLGRELNVGPRAVAGNLDAITES